MPCVRSLPLIDRGERCSPTRPRWSARRQSGSPLKSELRLPSLPMRTNPAPPLATLKMTGSPVHVLIGSMPTTSSPIGWSKYWSLSCGATSGGARPKPSRWARARMSARGAVAAVRPSSAAETANRSTSAFAVRTLKAGRARTSSAKPPMPQPAASSAVSRANEFANVPIAIVLHTGTSDADPISAGVLAEGDALSVNRFCWTSRAVH
jgi:hypothetical protein